jgi:formate dehydrogenase accessory protein FdhD
MPRPVVRVPRSSWRATGTAESERAIPEETAIAFTFNTASYAVMMASPQDLEDFAVGFALTEGVVSSLDAIDTIEVVEEEIGIELRVWLKAKDAAEFLGRRRKMAGPTGCGLCGVESLKAAVRAPAPLTRGATIDPAAIHRAFEALPARQPLHRSTGAAHAAAWADASGTLIEVREDVGRHNALDKLVGALVGNRFAPRAGFALVTSRASVEMVQKAASAGIGLLAAISAPTAYATRVAATAGLTLVGMARAGRLTAYTHPDHLCGP